MKQRKLVGLLGGSFNPAHGGHRHISLRALDALGLNEVWWLVSPQNPLKPRAGMAALEKRLAEARRVARHPRIVPTDIERGLGTTRTLDTISALQRRFPHIRFVWLMGADNLAQFHRWWRWRNLARRVPIVVIARPHYVGRSQTAPAAGWLRRWRRSSPAALRSGRLPLFLFLNLGLDPRSATTIRATRPDWAASEEAH